MRFNLSLISTFAILFSLFAQADEIQMLTPIDSTLESPTLITPPQNLKLVGKGLKNRRTGEQIALACVGPLGADQVSDCTRLQFIYFPADAEPRFEGAIYQVAQSGTTKPNQDEIKSEVKTITGQYRDWVRNSDKLSDNARTGITYGAFATVFTGQAIGMLSNISKIGGIYLAGALVLFYVGAAAFVGLEGHISVGAGEISSVIRDQKGWNWSTHPEKINNHKFNKFHEFVTRQ